MKRTNIYLPEKMVKILNQESSETGESVSSIIRKAISDYQTFDDREGGGYLCLLALSLAVKQFYEKINDDLKGAMQAATFMINEAKEMCINYGLDENIYLAIEIAYETLIRDYRDFSASETRHYPSIYIIKNKSTGNIKIGYSVNVESRLLSLKSGSDSELEIIKTKSGTFKDEKKLHKMFKDERLLGEWFKDSKEIRKAFDDI